MEYVQIFSRIVAPAQSKYEVVKKDVTQQSSYNLDLKLMENLKEKGVIVQVSTDHYEISNDYSLVLGDGILKLIGQSYANENLNVVFIYTEANDGTKKFQIKRKENKEKEYRWFSELYDRNYEGSEFMIYLDETNKKIKFDTKAPYDLNEKEYVLLDQNSNISLDTYCEIIDEYCLKYQDNEKALLLFGIDYSKKITEDKINLEELLKQKNLEKSISNLKNGINIGLILRERNKSNKYNSTNDIGNKKNVNESLNKTIGYNKIYYGIPGCGKSYKINAMLHHEPDFIDEAIKNNITTKADETDIFRTTFYSDYSNSDFIGQIYPSVNDEGYVTYIHVPGPFTEALERALLNKNRMIYLVIEEINRGNAAAIFGDTFQLLDRLKENKDGRVVGDSEYPVSNTFIEDYFEKRNKELEAKNEEKIEFKKGQIYIPHNLTILATMNTSDQNVFPLDTAFKRRWDREKVVTNWNEVGEIKNMYVPYTDITWKEFATTVNEAILNVDSDSDIAISEDKQMGAYFVQKNMLTEKPNTEDKDALITFTSNVIDYLYNDVTKFDHSLLFEKSVNSYDKLYDRMNHYKALVEGNKDPNVGKNAKVLSEFFNSKIIDKFVDTTKEQGNNDEQGTEN